MGLNKARHGPQNGRTGPTCVPPIALRRTLLVRNPEDPERALSTWPALPGVYRWEETDKERQTQLAEQAAQCYQKTEVLWE